MRFSSSFLTVQKIVISLHKRMKKIIFFSSTYYQSIKKCFYHTYFHDSDLVEVASQPWFWMPKKTEAKKSVITYIVYWLYYILQLFGGPKPIKFRSDRRSVFPIDLACQEGLKTTQHPSSQTPLKLWCEPNSAGGFLLYTYAAMSATVYRASIKLRLMQQAIILDFIK